MTGSKFAPEGGILGKILRETRDSVAHGRPVLAVFDLDSTLFDLHFRVARIIDTFAQTPEYQARYPKECAALKDIQILRSDWGIGEALVRLGMKEADHKEFYRDLHQFWATWFFSDDYLKHDEPLPGSVEFVKELQRLGAQIMYLTGRDIPRMMKGTVESLRDRGFPVEVDGVETILKPEAGMDDARFKVDILKEAEKKYSKIWLFENEPVNLNLCAKECPNVGLVFIESTHSGREQVADTLDRIVHFEVDLEEFRKLQG